jgi:hypothetical protein
MVDDSIPNCLEKVAFHYKCSFLQIHHSHVQNNIYKTHKKEVQQSAKFYTKRLIIIIIYEIKIKKKTTTSKHGK